MNVLLHVASFLSREKNNVEKLRNESHLWIFSLSVSHFLPASGAPWRKNTASHLTSNAGQVEFCFLKGRHITRLGNPHPGFQRVCGCSNTHSHTVRRVKVDAIPVEMTVNHEKPKCARASCQSELDPNNKSLEHLVVCSALNPDL